MAVRLAVQKLGIMAFNASTNVRSLAAQHAVAPRNVRRTTARAGPAHTSNNEVAPQALADDEIGQALRVHAERRRRLQQALKHGVPLVVDCALRESRMSNAVEVRASCACIINYVWGGVDPRQEEGWGGAG